MKIDHSVLVLVIILVTGNDYIISGNGKAKAEDIEEVVETVLDEDFCDNCTEVIVTSSCDGETSPFGCCTEYPDKPAHGENEKGCCANSEHGCCPDNLSAAFGPFSDGCNCEKSEFGCCPDNLTPASGISSQILYIVYTFLKNCLALMTLQNVRRKKYLVDCKSSSSSTYFPTICNTVGFRNILCHDMSTHLRRFASTQGLNNTGCGCQFSEFGCCPDSTTEAKGEEFLGCSCETYQHGCCMDGIKIAEGPNLEGCTDCNGEFGCCPDGVTPKKTEEEECGCESSKYGCCLDMETPATGSLFEGCLDKPDPKCHLPPQTGPCTNYTAKWFYDTKYGGCSRFWYGGCEPGPNHFDDEAECKQECENPKGPHVCFLRKNAGSCQGVYNEWYFDMEARTCAPLLYSGCLGNGNRFLTQEHCQDMCTVQEDVELCLKPKMEGSCDGNFSRWFYNKEEGQCESFTYSGCNGNNNRFVSSESCENACRHLTNQRRTEIICNLPILEGNCGEEMENATLAKWGYDNRLRRCVPFYYTGCNGNENSFDTASSCEEVCPTTFPPMIRLPRGGEILAERGSAKATLYVTIRANPPASVEWSLNGQPLSKHSTRHVFTENYLQISEVTDLDAGKYVVKATNGVGKGPPAEATIQLIVYPLFPTLEIKSEKTLFAPGEDAMIPCEMKAYPFTEIIWYKSYYKNRRRMEEPITEDNRIYVETYQVGIVTTLSQLIIRNVTIEDRGGYKCETSSSGRKVSDTEGIGVGGLGSTCIDRPSYTHCDKIVEHNFCGSKYYGQFCCLSCTNAGFLPGGF